MKVHWGLTCWHSLGFKALVKLSCSSWPWTFAITFLFLSIFACAYFKRFILLVTKSAFNKKRREILGAGSKFERLTIMVKHLRAERKGNLLFIPYKVLTFPTIFFSDLIMPPNSSEDSLFMASICLANTHFNLISQPCLISVSSSKVTSISCSIPQGCGTPWLCKSWFWELLAVPSCACYIKSVPCFFHL